MAIGDPGFADHEVGCRSGHSLYPTGVRQILATFCHLYLRWPTHVFTQTSAPTGRSPVLIEPVILSEHDVTQVHRAFGNTAPCFFIPLLEPVFIWLLRVQEASYCSFTVIRKASPTLPVQRRSGDGVSVWAPGLSIGPEFDVHLESDSRPLYLFSPVCAGQFHCSACSSSGKMRAPRAQSLAQVSPPDRHSQSQVFHRTLLAQKGGSVHGFCQLRFPQSRPPSPLWPVPRLWLECSIVGGLCAEHDCTAETSQEARCLVSEAPQSGLLINLYNFLNDYFIFLTPR